MSSVSSSRDRSASIAENEESESFQAPVNINSHIARDFAVERVAQDSQQFSQTPSLMRQRLKFWQSVQDREEKALESLRKPTSGLAVKKFTQKPAGVAAASTSSVASPSPASVVAPVENPAPPEARKRRYSAPQKESEPLFPDDEIDSLAETAQAVQAISIAPAAAPSAGSSRPFAVSSALAAAPAPLPSKYATLIEMEKEKAKVEAPMEFKSIQERRKEILRIEQEAKMLAEKEAKRGNSKTQQQQQTSPQTSGIKAKAENTPLSPSISPMNPPSSSGRLSVAEDSQLPAVLPALTKQKTDVLMPNSPEIGSTQAPVLSLAIDLAPSQSDSQVHNLSSPPAIPMRPSREKIAPLLSGNSLATPKGAGKTASSMPNPSSTLSDSSSADFTVSSEPSELVVVTEKIPSATPVTRASSASTSNPAYREQIISEIISSEFSYVGALKTLVSEFIHPLKSSQTDFQIPQSDISSMFSNVELLYNFHQILLVELERKSIPIAEILLKYGDFLKMYTQYLNGYTAALNSIDRHRRNMKFQSFLSEKRKKCGGQDISSYLITPVQRVPRYELLLRELLKYTPLDHPEYPKLVESLEKIKLIALHINNTKRIVENMSKLLEIQNHIHGEFGTLMLPHRKFICSGAIQKLSNGGILMNKSWNSRIVYLFNDILIWTGNNGKFRGYMELENAKCELYKEKKQKFGFRVSNANESAGREHAASTGANGESSGHQNTESSSSFAAPNSGAQDLVFLTANEADANQWLKQVSESIRNLNEANEQAKKNRVKEQTQKKTLPDPGIQSAAAERRERIAAKAAKQATLKRRSSFDVASTGSESSMASPKSPLSPAKEN